MGMLILFAALAVGSPSASGAAPSANFINLDLRQDRYLGEALNSSQQPNYTQLSLRLNVEPKRRKLVDYRFAARAQGTFESRDETYFGVPELYVGSNTLPWKLTAGRKKRVWSKLDEAFHLGIWQPELRWDYLAPEQQGLTGFFAEYEAYNQLHFLIFASPINIPDQGPQYRLEKGQFYSANRWFQQPTSAIRLFNGTAFANDAPLYFEIARPSDQALLMNPSLGVGLDYQAEGGYFFRANYAYKPRNQVLLGLECQNCANLGAPTPLEITAIIHGQIIQHHVATLETGFERVENRGYVSFTGDFPARSRFPDEYIEGSLRDMFITGASYQHYAGRLAGCPSWLQYSYMKAFELRSKSKPGLMREEQVQSSLDRYPLNHVAALDWRVRLSPIARVQWTNRYLYSIPEQGGWLSSQVEWNQGPVAWVVGADILGSHAEPGSANAGLFTNYRSNDRVFGGVSYVF